MEFLFDLACEVTLMCKTCNVRSTECTTCDPDAQGGAHFLRSSDKSCVTMAQCAAATSPFYWDTDNNECTGKLALIMLQKLVEAIY